MHAIEFYTTPSGEVIIKEQGQPERQLKESDTDFIQRFLEVLEEFYPEAYTALRKYYARYDGNKCYRDFLAVRRLSNATSGCMTTCSISMRTGISNLSLSVVRCVGNAMASKKSVNRSSTAHFQTVNLG